MSISRFLKDAIVTWVVVNAATQFCPICEEFLSGTIVLVDKQFLYHIGRSLAHDQI